MFSDHRLQLLRQEAFMVWAFFYCSLDLPGNCSAQRRRCAHLQFL